MAITASEHGVVCMIGTRLELAYLNVCISEAQSLDMHDCSILLTSLVGQGVSFKIVLKQIHLRDFNHLSTKYGISKLLTFRFLDSLPT